MLKNDSRRTRDYVEWDTQIEGYRYKSNNRKLGTRGEYRMVAQEIMAYERAIDRLTNNLLQEQISFEDWQKGLSNLTRDSHVNLLRLGRGGSDRTFAIHYLEVGRDLKTTHYTALRQFAVDIKSGKLSPAQIAARAKYYARSSRAAYEYARLSYQKEKADSNSQARRKLGSCAPHCPDCISYANLGWVSLSELILPTKKCQCRMNCCCSVEYRTKQQQEAIQQTEITQPQPLPTIQPQPLPVIQPQPLPTIQPQPLPVRQPEPPQKLPVTPSVTSDFDLTSYSKIDDRLVSKMAKLEQEINLNQKVKEKIYTGKQVYYEVATGQYSRLESVSGLLEKAKQGVEATREEIPTLIEQLMGKQTIATFFDKNKLKDIPVNIDLLDRLAKQGGAIEISWFPTDEEAAELANDRQKLKAVLEARKLFKEKVMPTLKEGDIVYNKPLGGMKGARAKAYERQGFSSPDFNNIQYSIVKNGKLEPIRLFPEIETFFKDDVKIQDWETRESYN